MLGFGPLITKPANQHLIHRHQRRVGQHGKECGIRLSQRDLKRGIVNGFYTQHIRCFFPLSDISGVNNMHVARIAGIRRGGFGVCQTLPAPDHILRGNRGAVTPCDAWTQMKSPDGVVFVLPFFCQPWLYFTSWRNANQPFEDIADNIEFDIAFDFMRVK